MIYPDPHLEAQAVSLQAIAADGGTLEIEVTIDGKQFHMYIDRRINSTTPGELYTVYPGLPDAKMIDPQSHLAMTVKGQLIKAI